MHTEISTSGYVTVVTFPARMARENAEEIRREIQGTITDIDNRYVLDMRNVEYIDFSGLAVFLAVQRSLQAVSGKAVLVNPTIDILAFIELTCLHNSFESYSDRVSAVNSFHQYSQAA